MLIGTLFPTFGRPGTGRLTAGLCGGLLALAAAGAASAAADSREFLETTGDGATRGLINPSACPGGLRYDDGGYEGGVGFANAVPVGSYVMAFDLPTDYTPLSTCLCWTRTEFSNGTAVNFDVVFYAADGVDGQPGTFLGRVPARAENVPQFDTEGMAMYPVPLPALPTPLPSRVYIGAEWEPFVDRQFYLCNDSSPETTLNEAWSTIDDGQTWDATSPVRPSYRSLGTVLYGGVPAGPAEPVPLPAVGVGLAVGLLGFGLARLRRRERARHAARKGGG